VSHSGKSDEDWREFRADMVWKWLDRNGGWWGNGTPDVKTLITWLLIREGSVLMNKNVVNNREIAH
jgi:hypothetical protein